LWHSVLEQAAEQLDGGPRSFALADESTFIHYAYDPPNEAYQKLFFRQATVSQSQSQSDSLFHSASAGWLIPDDTSDCKPVFIAHSLLSAIWLLWKSLPHDPLNDEAWSCLVSAAQSLAAQEDSSEDTDQDEVPPSGQEAAAAAASSLLPSRKRRTSLLQELPSSCKRTQMERLQAAQLPSPRAASPALSDSTQVSEVSVVQDRPPAIAVQTVTNNNRRAERARANRAAVRAEQKMVNLGLLSPGEHAESRELVAYRSIEPQDAPSISWILKQDIDGDCDLYHRSKNPYSTATDMLRKARSLGNRSALENAGVFLQRWRTVGSPFSPGVVAGGGGGHAAAPVATQLSVGPEPAAADVASSELYYTYNLARHYGTRLATVHIEYRWAMAFLGRAYSNKIAALQKEDELAGCGKYRQGRGKVRSEAQQLLLQLIYPDLTASAAQKGTLKNLLQRALRWYDAATMLGWGSLCLMPHDAVTNNWAEKTLTVPEWRIWLKLAKKVNVEAYKASAAFDGWLGSEGIQGRSITGKETLCIEATAPRVQFDVEEVADSESDGDNDRMEDTSSVESSIGGGGGGGVQTSKRPTPARSLRQVSLLDLFRPVAE
jgi:hypothetical protein